MHLLKEKDLTGGFLTLTQSSSFPVEAEDLAGAGTLILTAEAAFSGARPEIYAEIFLPGQDRPLYRSRFYRVGGEGDFLRQQWRLPPLCRPGAWVVVSFLLEEGSDLSLKELSIHPEGRPAPKPGAVRFNAHLGFYGLAPENTMPAFALAAQCGFASCICVPKLTKDGVLVCLHDELINRTARDADGKRPAEDIRVDSLSYEELLAFDFGLWKNEIYRGTRIPRVEDFFALCAKTGMRPMFSTHPPLLPETWEEVGRMLDRYGLRSVFHIKSFSPDTLKTAFSVFGYSIDGYTLDTGSYAPDTVNAARGTGIDPHHCRFGIEVRAKDYTEEMAKEIMANGFFAAAWANYAESFAWQALLINYGVREFTEDYHCSMGLAW